jgi:hypothetical protein
MHRAFKFGLVINRRTAKAASASWDPAKRGSSSDWEWVEDCEHANYEGAPEDGSAWMADGDCNKRILRGGSYNSYSRALRSASRHADRTDIRLKVHGFRIARTLSARGSTITVSPTEH